MIPTLHTARLTLRAFRQTDLPAYAALFANPDFVRHLGTGDTRSEEEVWTLMARHLGQWHLRGYGVFALELQGACIGHAGLLHPYAWPEPELAYSIAPAAQGQGLATEAASAAFAWAAETRGITRPISYIRPANAGSIAVARKLGAQLEAELELAGGPALRFRHTAAIS